MTREEILSIEEYRTEHKISHKKRLEELGIPFWSNHDAAVRAAIVYSLFSSCKAHDVDVRSWLEDTLRRIPTEKSIDQLLAAPTQAPQGSK